MIRIVTGVLAIAVIGSLAACASPKVPGSNSSVESAARVYLQSAKDGKCDVTSALTNGSTWSWCNNPRLKSYRITKGSYTVAAQGNTPSETCVHTMIDSTAKGINASFSGKKSWDFCFVKRSSGWKLQDQGQG